MQTVFQLLIVAWLEKTVILMAWQEWKCMFDVGKATGLDKISNRLLKISADVVASSLTGIFNQSILFGIFSSDWKLAKVSPIFKNGSRSDLNNYRPISVIPSLSKICIVGSESPLN